MNNTLNKKNNIIKICKDNISLQEKGEISIEKASYNICGICGILTDDELKAFPEISSIMDIACDLELSKEYRDRPLDDWKKIKDIISKIK